MNHIPNYVWYFAFLCLVLLCGVAWVMWHWSLEHPWLDQTDQQGVQIAKQGHRYKLGNQSVLALSTGEKVEVLAFNSDLPWRDSIMEANAIDLIPQPMVYFGDQVPK